jgi:hypothetical protein
VAEGTSGVPVWDIVAQYLPAHGTLPAPRPNRPALVGVEGDAGIA